MIFRHIVFSSLLIGLITGSIHGVFQQTQIAPLFRAAEQYEMSDGSISSPSHHSGNHTHAMPAGLSLLSPTTGHYLFALGSNILIAIAFTLILVSLMTLHNLKSSKPETDVVSGLGWGMAMMITVFVAPWMAGLQPNLPGTVTAALPGRQLLWLICITTTGAGLATLYYSTSWHKFIGPGLLLIPYYLIRSRSAEFTFVSTTPDAISELTSLTATVHLRTFTGMLVFYLLLGALSGYAVRKSGTAHA
jgi:predicted cobalt transporter CbtA